MVWTGLDPRLNKKEVARPIKTERFSGQTTFANTKVINTRFKDKTAIGCLFMSVYSLEFIACSQIGCNEYVLLLQWTRFHRYFFRVVVA